MSVFNRKDEISSYLNNVSQNDATKNNSNLVQILSPLNNRKIHPRQNNNSAFINPVMTQSQVLTPNRSFNSQNIDNSNYLSQNQDAFNPFNSSQFNNLQSITQNENQKPANYSIREFNSQTPSNQSKIRKISFPEIQLIKNQRIEDQSTNYSQNKNSQINSLPIEIYINSPNNISDPKKNLDQFFSSPYKNLHKMSQSQQLEQKQLQDRTQQLFRVSNSKNFNFKPTKYPSEQIQSDSNTSIKQIQSNIKTPTIVSNSIPYQTENENNRPSSFQLNVQEEQLKDWLVGKEAQKFQPVLSNEFNQQIQNQFLSNNSYTHSPNQSQVPQTEQQNITIRKRRYRNSKELQNFDNNVDTSGNLSLSNDSNLSSQPMNAQNSSHFQNKPAHQPSIFNPQYINLQVDQESNQDQTKSVVFQQKQFNHQISPQPSQTALKQILQSTAQNSPLTSIQPPDLFQLQKKGYYKPRQNKLQKWMNETNMELSQNNDLVTENSESFDFNKRITNNLNQETENLLAQIKYQPSVFEDQQRMTKSKFLPQIENIEKKDNNAQQSLSKRDINFDFSGQKNQLNIQNEIESNNFIIPRHKSSLSLPQSQIIQESINFENQEIPAKKKIKTIKLSNDYIIRRMSEPKISDIKNQDKQNDENIYNKPNHMKKNQSTNQIKSINSISNSCINSMKNSLVKEVKSILKNKTETSIMSNKPSLRNIESITDNEIDETFKVRHSFASTKIGNSSSTLGGISFSKDLLKSQVLDETPSQRNQKSNKKVNFKERVSIVDIRTNEKSISSITQLQNQTLELRMKNNLNNL